jgi:cholesterol transport system auxiliary component
MDATAVALAAGLLMLSLLSACGKEHPIHYYAINRPLAPEAPARPNGPILLVGRITSPEALQDIRIRYRSGSNEAGAYEYHRWTERPDAMVRDLLVQRLRATGHYAQVQEASGSAGGDFLIRGKLYEFSEVDEPGIQTRVSLQLELVARKSGLVVWSHTFNRNQPVQGKTMNDVVSSLDHNLQQVIADSASAIDTFLSSQKSR